MPAPGGVVSLAGGEVWVPCFPAPELSGAYISPSSPSPLLFLGTWELQAVVDALTGTRFLSSEADSQSQQAISQGDAPLSKQPTSCIPVHTAFHETNYWQDNSPRNNTCRLQINETQPGAAPAAVRTEAGPALTDHLLPGLLSGP